MNLTIKSYKRVAKLSEETDCFTCDIYLDGKKVGQASNRGNGGCNDYYWTDRTIGQSIENWAKTQPTEFEFEKLDQIISKLTALVEVVNTLKRRTKNTTWFRLTGDKVGAWHVIKHPYEPKVKEQLIKLHGDKLECIANEDFEKAATFC